MALLLALGLELIKLVVNQGGGQYARHRIDGVDGRHDGTLARTFQGHHQLALITDGMDLGPSRVAISSASW